MAYIGQEPVNTFSPVPSKDSFTGDGSTTAFDLANVVVPGGENALEVFIDNVRQEPGSGKAFTLDLDGSNENKRITFTAAPANGAAIYVINDKTSNVSVISPSDLNGVELILDADADTSLTADTDDQIDFRIAGTDHFKILGSSGDTVIQPMTDAKDIIFKQFDGRNILEINDAGFVALANGATGSGQLRIYEDTDNGTNFTALQVGTQSADITYTLPTADGTSGFQLTTDGSGTLSWAAAGATVSNNTNNRILTATGGTSLNGEANLTFDGSTLTNAGATQLNGTLTIGANDQGYDIIFHGDTASANVTFDTSADDLIFNGAAGLIVPDGQFTLGSTAVSSTAAELNILDGATVVVGEINALDLGATAVGTAIASKAVILDSNKDYTGIRNLTISGEIDAATGDFSGDVDVDGTLEADAITIAGVTLAETISDTVGAMVGSNTETGITVTYQDGDNTLDFALGAAQTTITSLLATDIKIGEDDQTKIDFETADTIHFYAGNQNQIKLVDGALAPITDSDVDLGTSSLEFKDGYFDGTVHTDAINLNGTAISSTAAEINLIDGGATVGTTAIADGDGLLHNDAGTMRVTTVQTFATYFASEITAMGNLVETGALDAGSISSGFGNIDNGASNITSGGLVKLDVDTDADDVSADSATGRLTLGASEDLNLYHGGTHSYIVNDTGNLVIDTAGDLTFDAAGNDFKFLANGTEILNITNSSSDVVIKPLVDTKDIIFQQRDGTEVARIEDNATFNVSVAGKFAYAGTAVTSTAAELNILDGVTSTAAEINIIDGDTNATSTTLADADRVVVNDNGTMVQVAMTDVKTYIGGGTSWQAIKTGNFTAAAGQGVFANTTSSAFTVTLPASPDLGDEVSIVDYAGTFDSNACTIGRNSQPIMGVAEDLVVSTERASFTLVYVDGTQGWLFKGD